MKPIRQTGHGETFGDTVDGDDAVFDFGKLGDAFVFAHEVDVLIDFVGHDEEVLVAGNDVGDGFELVFGVEHACGVAGAGEHDEFGLGGDGGFELFGGYFEVVFDGGFDIDALAFGHTDDFFIADPEWGGDDDFVARVDEALDQLVDALFGTRGDDDLLGFELEAVVAAEFFADGFFEVGIARHGRIVGKVVVDGFLGGFLHGVGGVEVGFADGEADNIFALSFQFAGFGGHGEGLALGHVENSVAEDFHSICF